MDRNNIISICINILFQQSLNMVYKVIEIICGIVFVFTGILKLIDLGNTSQYFAFIFELNYSLIQLLLIFLSLLEITIGFSLVVGIWQMSAVYYSIISLLLFFILIDIYFYMMGISNCGCDTMCFRGWCFLSDSISLSTASASFQGTKFTVSLAL